MSGNVILIYNTNWEQRENGTSLLTLNPKTSRRQHRRLGNNYHLY
jgi:threonyl-tRNA synthetase